MAEGSRLRWNLIIVPFKIFFLPKLHTLKPATLEVLVNGIHTEQSSTKVTYTDGTGEFNSKLVSCQERQGR